MDVGSLRRSADTHSVTPIFQGSCDARRELLDEHQGNLLGTMLNAGVLQRRRRRSGSISLWVCDGEMRPAPWELLDFGTGVPCECLS